jgi:hypothetical protein
MPDWSYRTLLRPALFTLSPERARDLTLGTTATLTALPEGGAVLIETFGDLAPQPTHISSLSSRMTVRASGARWSPTASHSSWRPSGAYGVAHAGSGRRSCWRAYPDSSPPSALISPSATTTLRTSRRLAWRSRCGRSVWASVEDTAGTCTPLRDSCQGKTFTEQIVQRPRLMAVAGARLAHSTEPIAHAEVMGTRCAGRPCHCTHAPLRSYPRKQTRLGISS